MYIVTADEMQEMDRQTIEDFGIPGRVLMENAGRAAAQVFLDKFSPFDKNVGIIAGRGNNGGDGFVIARYLYENNINVTVYLLSRKELVSGDAEANLNLLSGLDIEVLEIPDNESFIENRMSIIHQHILIDSIFGTGLNSDVKGFYREFIEFINSLKRRVFAVDIPSGLNSDTGQPCGTCIKAEATVTFGHPKIGHFLLPGAEYSGELEIIDIGIPGHITKNAKPSHHLLTPEVINSYFKPRPLESHKGTTGHLFVIAGSPGKTGAASLTAMSAMHVGAGLVTLGIPKSLNSVLETQVLEVMTCPLPETKTGELSKQAFEDINKKLIDKKCLAIGPGIGTSEETKQLILKVINNINIPIIIDADGLNCLAGNTRILKKMNTPAILTPHPGEMARMIDCSTKAVQQDRIKHARSFAVEFNSIIVLKGARTLIAHPDGRVFINTTGNPGMASGGMGDVLTGIIAGLLTQGFTPENACHAGVYLHGKAADTLVLSKGPFGFIASEVMKAAPEQISNFFTNSFI
ncbi:MAG: NAD(P)H-hydrate dehydratase [Desulfobacterales bacterium]|nr:NAD(P)H-hydrate dehydratase [Desulfobacteraceae bacterium]MBT7085556.1 NAD(P)H-hydrate dehydratase [Desulfobacterales bacterium]MBT7695931.1 NAD(P)H-hydrate dehydratase [Desulfobacterales bacterium]